MHLLVDPVVLCFPTDMRAAEPVEEFLGYINRWGQLIFRNHGNVFYIPERCDAALHHEQCLLNLRLVKMRFLEFGNQFAHLSANTTTQACKTILERLEYGLPKLKAVSYNSITLTPKVLYTRILSLNPAIANSLQDTLADVAWAQNTGDKMALSLRLFTHPIPGGPKNIQIDVNLKSGGTVTGRLPIECLH